MPAKKRRAPRKRTAAAPKPPAQPVTAPPGQRLFILEVPYEARQYAGFLGARWDAARRCTVYVGTALPAALEPFRPAAFSWAAWQEDEASGVARRTPPQGNIELRPHQLQARRNIVAAYDDARPGFLLADDVGLGKTYTAISAIHELDDVENVLVVAPLAVQAGWRRSLEQLGDGGKRWCVINWDRLQHLVTVPSSAAAAKKTKTKNRHIADHGKPLVRWDAVVFDESHYAKNPTSQRARLARTLSARSFRLWMSATAGQNPLDLSYLAELLARITGDDVSDLNDFERWAASQGIQVRRAEYGKWVWERNDEDLHRLRALLFEGSHPAGLRRVATDINGWPAQQRIPHPVELTPSERVMYQNLWTEFRAQMQLDARGTNPRDARAAQTRFRQKASLLRVPSVAAHAADLVANGRKVFVSLVWRESLDAFVEQLEKAGLTVAQTHGGMPAADREQARLHYQRGDAQVMVATVIEGINLHSSEEGADRSPRVTVIHDPRWTAREARQIEGRGTRDGTHAPAYYCFAEQTAEERVVSRLLETMHDLGTMHGDDLDDVHVFEQMLHDRASASEHAFLATAALA